ncbi:glycoprotein 2 [Botrytis cinerea negative-stranded RNA virus 4]|uniref:Glycoprotein 2 n=1 Tax=Botrytis cinerea negative-stranded RNA virus 4 TaxID=2735939 RepID=A0AAE7AMH8_9MONO|nr:glycoprotein 2 [Botrytis cinerea negative-stranded RNA virus 4]QJT73700.1 glycoprotein 2 [Botrytis cinerea negative-stranded RNA virus 4]
MSDYKRTLPTEFFNKNTYALVDDDTAGKIPVVDENKKFSYGDILQDNDAFPARLCMLGLLNNEEIADIVRLVAGGLLNASNTKLSAAKVQGYDPKKKYSPTLKAWYISHITKEKPIGKPEDDGQESSEEDLMPTNDLPDWYQELDLDNDQIDAIFSASNIEVYAYMGILAMAIAKQPNAANLDAFNMKRRQAVVNSMPSDTLHIFVDDSPFLTVELLSRVHRSFNLIIEDRALLFSAIVDRNHALLSGEHRMFFTLFRLTAGASLNPLILVTRFVRKYPHLFNLFPELHTEYFAAAVALRKFSTVPAGRRLYLKLIFGNAYVPIPRGDIDELLGMAVYVLKQEETSLSNYNGGTLSDGHREKLAKLLQIKDNLTEASDPEEPSSK